ncbi:unnamed protein product [Diabrotica balteata]|uniref:Cytoplasmic tRNA 2-thiolation protein 2 n=1 Tax=Diabrotica balteata TaxID=107213 RepID=A0A9N9SPL7_DIABA|nr:unnamed protein product [Diabrotica balteata]
MCSVGDDVYDNEADKLMPITKTSKIAEVCNKCRTEKPCIVLRSKDAYCQNCFLVGTVHKFKALLGKSRLIHPKDKVLVWHQIGHPSTALLHFLRTGLDLNTPKKLRFEPIILFVDDQYHISLDERRHLLEKAKKEVQSFGFTLYLISFADYVTQPYRLNELICTENVEISEDDKNKLEQIIDGKPSKSNKNDIKVLLRRQMLIDSAKHFKCKFIFTPEISVDIASNLLSNISLGRGPHISIDTGFCDDRDDDVKILRPLRLFDMKELAFYNKINNLEPLIVRQLDVNPYSSIQDLMKKFVQDLQVNYPATVTTVLKTGDKLSIDKRGMKHCNVCKGPLPVIEKQLTSQQSTNFSHLVSTEISNYSLSRQERYQNMVDKFDQMAAKNEDLCYACSNITQYLNKK